LRSGSVPEAAEDLEGIHRIKRKRDPDGKERAYMGRKRLPLGRRKQEPDPRDRLHTAKPPKRRPRAAATYRYWYDGVWRGDQGNTSQCVIYSGLHRIENAPRTYTAAGPILVPTTAYNRAQEIDEWPGNDYEGTSVRAGAKVMLEHGLISEYQWVYNMTDLIQLLHQSGPVVFGTVWWWSMFNPRRVKDAAGTYRETLVVDESQGDAGGHAYLANGLNLPGKVIRILNSWGLSWGANGRAWMSFATAEKLLFPDGEACYYVEV
jgi:hypothetical protein